MCVATELAFPEDHHAPSQFLERSYGSAITSNIAFELRQPILLTGPWPISVVTAGVLVPETSMHQDGKTMLRQDDIRRAWKVTAMQTEPVAQRV